MAELGGVMKELESLGTEQFRNTYKRHGAAEPLYGVSFTNLKAIARRVKRDHELAVALWETGNLDARTLATMIVDPALVDAKTADKWVSSLSYYMLVDLAAGVIARSPVALTKGDEWRVSEDEWVGQAGWVIIGALAKDDPRVPDSYFEARLDEIRAGIGHAKNRVRHAMNGALIAIGGARPALKARALGIAKAIGKVVVDHGETGCVTPDAVEYIAKMSERTEAAGGGVAPPAPEPEPAAKKPAAKAAAAKKPAAKAVAAAKKPAAKAVAAKKPGTNGGAAKKPVVKKPVAKAAAKKPAAKKSHRRSP